jgi:hypothetical protein
MFLRPNPTLNMFCGTALARSEIRVMVATVHRIFEETPAVRFDTILPFVQSQADASTLIVRVRADPR